MSEIKTGIVGCGKVADLHAAGLIESEKSRFTAVCDLDIARARAFAEKYGVDAFSSVEEMVKAGGVEMVTIATPHPVHAVATVAALDAGAHVLVEKPMASSLEDCDRMIAAARKAGKKLGMVSQRRLYEPVMRVKNAIDAGKIGKPVLAVLTMLGWRDEGYYASDPWRGTWKGEGGGVLVNQAPHQIDILQWYMGEIESLYGVWSNLNHPYIEVEDTALAVIRFKSGALGNIVVSNSQNPALYGKVHVHGENGASVGVQTDGGAMFIAGMSSITEPPYNDLWTVPGEEANLETWRAEITEIFERNDPMKRYHRLQIEDFLDAITDDRAPLVPGEEGRKTVEIFTAIYRSTRDRVPVAFPLTPESGRDDYDGRIHG